MFYLSVPLWILNGNLCRFFFVTQRDTEESQGHKEKNHVKIFRIFLISFQLLLKS